MNDRYRKKPVVVQAYQIGPSDTDRIRMSSPAPEWPGWFKDAVVGGVIFYDSDGIRIKTLEGTSYGTTPGYWIIRGVEAELWPVADSVFRKTYEAVPDDDSQT